jgi:hypothetical protein
LKEAAALEDVFDFDEEISQMFLEGFRWQDENEVCRGASEESTIQQPIKEAGQ